MLARARTQVDSSSDGLPVQGAALQQLGEPVRLGEQPDGHRRSGQRQRRQHDVDAGSARQSGVGGQARVDHRTRLVHPAVHRGDDPVDGLQQLRFRGETAGDPFHPAEPLDEDGLVAVDHDLRDRLVGQQRLEHAETDRLVDDAADQGGPLAGGEDDTLAGDQVREHPFQPCSPFLGGEPGELLQVHLVEEQLLEPVDLRVVGDDLGLVGGLEPREAAAELAPHGIVTDRLIVRSVITTMEGARAVTVTPWSGP